MNDKPNTISDKDWARLQRGAADKYGGLIKNADQKAATQDASAQRGKARLS